MLIWVVGKNGLLGKTLLQKTQGIGSSKEEADISDVDSLYCFAKKNPGITHIVNCSAFSQVDLAEEKKQLAHSVNALGPENLARLGKNLNAKVIHISTDFVFPGNIAKNLHEEDPVGPINYYGETKLEGERRLLLLDPSACVIRTSALFGHGGKSFIAKLLECFLEKEEVFLSNDLTNSPTYAEDLASAILQLLEASGIFHFSNSGEATKYDFGKEIFDFAKSQGFPMKVKTLHSVPNDYFPSKCKRPMYSVFDTTKVERITGPIRSWESALQDFLMRIK